MDVFGIDFTSRPRRQKPITCISCRLEGAVLTAGTLEEWDSFEQFEEALQRPGPWIAGIDMPFGQSRRFIQNIGWPQEWHKYVMHAHGLGRAGFRKALDDYRRPRAPGDKEHRRQTDIAAGAISSQKLYGVPVGLMFFEGAPRLIRAGVTIPHLQAGDPARIVVEAYPGVLARQFIGRRSYKQDTQKKQTAEHLVARQDLLAAVTGAGFEAIYGIQVIARQELCEDPGADHLDALLCAVQAAWAWSWRDHGFGAPTKTDPLEGWIADPIAGGLAAPG